MLNKGISLNVILSPLLVISVLTVACPGVSQEHPTKAQALHVQNC